MIICDFCNKRTNVETLILYSKTIDYCEECKPIVNKLKKQLEKSIIFYEEEKDKQIKQAEITILKKFKYGKRVNK